MDCNSAIEMELCLRVVGLASFKIISGKIGIPWEIMVNDGIRELRWMPHGLNNYKGCWLHYRGPLDG